VIEALQRQETPVLSVRHLCKMLHVNRRWYYASRQPSKAQEVEATLREGIEQIVQEVAGYGYRRVTHALRRAGWSVNHKRVLRIMREESLLCRHTRRFVHTTDSHHRYHVYPNLVQGMQAEAPDTVWVADLTYIRLPSTFAYLACVLDAYSRKCVGWKLSKRIDAQLAVDALDMALASRDVSPGLVHHSDRGVQYASTAYVQRLQGIGAKVSMSAVGNPYDNAKAESFFKTLKSEEVYLKEYHSFAEAEANLEQFIERVYNTKRLHSSLGYVSPVEFETTYVQGMRC